MRNPASRISQLFYRRPERRPVSGKVRAANKLLLAHLLFDDKGIWLHVRTSLVARAMMAALLAILLYPDSRAVLHWFLLAEPCDGYSRAWLHDYVFTQRNERSGGGSFRRRRRRR